MAKIEKRFVSGELRAEQTGGKTFLIGRAASYGVLSHDLGGWREIIQRGAFDDVLADPELDVVHTINHDVSKVLGRTTSATLRLTSDSHGLNYRTELPETTYAEDLAELCKRGDISASSFAFTVDPQGQTWSDVEDPDNPGMRCDLRTITRIESLHDVATVASPAYPATAAALSDRSLPPGIPIEVRNRIRLRAADDADECTCDCEACVDGDCENCDPENCQDPENCRCQTRSSKRAGAGDTLSELVAKIEAVFPDATEEEQAAAWARLEAMAEKAGVDTDDEGAADRARRLQLAFSDF